MRDLAPDDLLITSGDVPVAIAGIMGGAESEVTDSTRRVLLESAWFAPSGVRRTARRLGLRTEASYRFERNDGHRRRAAGGGSRRGPDRPAERRQRSCADESIRILPYTHRRRSPCVSNA